MTLLGIVNSSLRSNYSNCLQDSAVSIKLNLLLAMTWFLYDVELARGRVFGWIPWQYIQPKNQIDNFLTNPFKKNWEIKRNNWKSKKKFGRQNCDFFFRCRSILLASLDFMCRFGGALNRSYKSAGNLCADNMGPLDYYIYVLK